MSFNGLRLNFFALAGFTSLVSLQTACLENTGATAQGEEHKVGSCLLTGGTPADSKLVVLCSVKLQNKDQADPWHEVFAVKDFKDAIIDNSVCTAHPAVKKPEKTPVRGVIVDKKSGNILTYPNAGEACLDSKNWTTIDSYPATAPATATNSTTGSPAPTTGTPTTTGTGTTEPSTAPSGDSVVVDNAKRKTFTVKEGVNTFFKKDHAKSGSDPSYTEKCVLGSLSQGARKKTLIIRDFAIMFKNSWNLQVTIDEKICGFEPGSQGFLFMKDFENVPAEILEAMGKANN